ncbi:MAG: hypothetical protein Q7W45_08700 [Bacteroidota bacterium]|nr:hypothetical protein [Bacteroidota bacterium]MDP3144244.1 hypothetical protein [Bacteroidota bacterium]
MQTRTADIDLDDNNILHIVLLPDVKMDIEDAVDNLLVVRHFTKNKPCVKLIDIRAGFKIERKAKVLINKADTQKKTIARAILTGSSIKKVVFNFFLKYNSNSIPTKFFTEVNEAIEWLKAYQKKEI